MMASVSGRRTLTLMPWPSAESISTVPPSAVMFRLTTSMPTPRPETSVTTSAVEKPGAKIRPQTSASVMRRARRGRARAPCSAACRGSGRVPSSRTSMTMLPPWWLAASVMVPVSALPLAARSAGISMPWSQLLRTRCVSGSVIFSTRPLSSSVASPWVTNSTFLPSLAGEVAQHAREAAEHASTSASCGSTSPTPAGRGCCAPGRPGRRRAAGAAPGRRLALVCASIACVMTSSPTRLISWSTFSTETRKRRASAAPAAGALAGGLAWRGGSALPTAAGARRAARRSSARRAGRVVEEAEARVGTARLAARRAHRRGSRSPGPSGTASPARERRGR